MKINTIWMLGVCLLCVGLLPLKAQQNEKCVFCMERLKADNPWIGAKNASGLIFNRFNDFSYVEGGILTESGDFRNITDPTSLFNSRLKTESFRKINRLSFYGSFEFDYIHMQNKCWSSVLHPENTFFIMADSLPGRQTLESYKLNGGVGFELNKQWAIGAGISYLTASNAKKRDIRNKNTYMEMTVHPGVLFRSQYLNLGVNFNYERMTEKIEDKRYGSGSNPTLFMLEGLWFHKSIQLTETSTEIRQIQNDGYGGAAQLELLFGDFRFFNQFSATKTDQVIWINHVNGQKGGEQEQTDFDYQGTLSMEKENWLHELKGNFANRERLGFENIQREELVDGFKAWVQYGRKNKGILETSEFGLHYTLYRDRTCLDNSWRATVGFDRKTSTQKYKLFPVTYQQEIEQTTFQAGFHKNFRLKSGCIDCGLLFTLRNGDGTMFKISSEDPEISGENLYPQLGEQLEQEYNYLRANYYGGELHLKYTYPLNRDKGQSLYADLKLNRKNPYDSPVDGHRTGFGFLLGFCF